MTIKSLIITLLLLFACQKNNLGELLKKSENYAEGGNLKKALSLAMEAYDMNPENDRVKIALSKIYATEAKDHVENADCDSATRSANRSLDFYSDNDSAYNTLAVCAVVEKNFAKCIIYANKQLALEKQYKNVAYSVHHNLSVCYRELKI